MGLGTASAGVTTSSTTIVPENRGRAFLTLVNDSDTDVYLSESGPAVVGSGIRINAGGGVYDVRRAGNRHRIHVGEIRAIHGGVGTKNVAISEQDGR